MQKDQQVFDNFPVWVSYSRQNLDLLRKLHMQMYKANVGSCVAKALGALGEQQQREYQDIRLEIISDRNNYSLEDPEHSLAPGDSIDRLSRDIGNCALKMMVISPDYFQTQACLEELYLSLCSRNRQEGMFPFIYFTGFREPKKVFTDKHIFFRYPDAHAGDSKDSAVANTIECTLVEALKSVHRYLVQNYTEDEWTEFDLSEQFVGGLPRLLTTWSKIVFASSDTQSETVGDHFVCETACDNEAKKLVVQVYRYGYRFIERIARLDQYDLNALYEKWLESRQQCPLSNYIKQHCNFEKVKSLSQATLFVRQIIDGFDDKKISATDVDHARVNQLCSILVIKAINSFSMPLKRVFRSENVPLEVFVSDDTKLDFYSTQQAAITFSVTRGFLPRGMDKMNPSELRGAIYPGAATTKPLTPDSDDKTAIAKLFENLIFQLFPTNPIESIDIDDFNEDLRDQIRYRLEMMDQKSQCFVLLPYSEFSDPTGHLTILKKMEDILNEGFPDRVAIPAVITRNYRVEKDPTSNNTRKIGGDKLDIILSGRARTCLYTMIYDVSAAIDANLKNRRG